MGGEQMGRLLVRASVAKPDWEVDERMVGKRQGCRAIHLVVSLKTLKKKKKKNQNMINSKCCSYWTGGSSRGEGLNEQLRVERD